MLFQHISVFLADYLSKMPKPTGGDNLQQNCGLHTILLGGLSRLCIPIADTDRRRQAKVQVVYSYH